jgi:fatty-acyl-CoA synthase
VGSIGRQGCGCEVEIRDHNARPVRTGEPGEICVRGDNVLMGYWQDEAQTKKALQEGWFYSGDVAYKDAAGLFWFVDRIKQVIISGGENIYPAEIERVLLRHRDIEEVAVVGQPDNEWGEVPVAVIGASPNADGEQLKSYLHGRLARYKHPRQFYFIDALPRNAMGKIVAEEVKKEITRPATSSRAE